MSGTDPSEFPGTPRRKHRHDLGHEDHGPKVAAGTTRAIQTLLGLWIALTLVLVVYAMIGAAEPERGGSMISADEPERVGWMIGADEPERVGWMINGSGAAR
jgi:hypothetical protein